MADKRNLSLQETAAEEKVVDLLLKRGLTVTTAESCTGGMVASRLVNVPGVSEVLKEAFVTYSDEAKHALVNVSPETLERYGAVSARTASEMALGACAAAGADVSAAVTGLAGPGGGTKEKPVGLVYIACEVCGRLYEKKYLFDGDRAEVREKSAQAALELLLEGLEDTEDISEEYRLKAEGAEDTRTVKVRYFTDRIEKLKYIDGKSDWIDLRCAEDTFLKAGESGLVPLGVAMELPKGYEAHVVPRSSTFKNFGIIQTNHMGIIDESYCGDNDQWYMPVYALRDTEIHVNDRICQFRIFKHQPTLSFEETDELKNPDRGGFGSTGRA